LRSKFHYVSENYQVPLIIGIYYVKFKKDINTSQVKIAKSSGRRNENSLSMC